MPGIRASARLLRHRTLALLATVSMIAGGTLVAAASPVEAASGTTYYVDCAASTNGSGTESSPWNSTTSVNDATFTAGESILFDRGTTCDGYLDPQGSGSSGAPITVDTYGTGALPLIAAAGTATAAFELNDQSYWTIQDLQITGGVDYGVYVTGDTANASLTNIDLTNLDVSDATGVTKVRGDSGEVYVYPRGTDETISNVTVNGVTAHDSDVGEGIFVGGAFGAFPPGTTVASPGDTPIGSNITIENSSAYDVAGDGILLTMAQNGTIEDSVAHNSGDCSSCGSTPSGLWEWYCQNCTLQYNESYDNETWANTDGGAFDIDNYNSNNTLQYNYGHNNDGYCLAVFGSDYTPTDDVFRYNVCSDNEQLSTSTSYEMSIWPADSTNLQIYNNTFYFNPANGHAFMQEPEAGTGGLFKNNIVYSTSANMLDDVANGMQSDNNIYYITTGASPTFSYAGTTYTGLAAYQAASGQDAHSLTSNPLLNNPTYASVGKSLTADTLESGSPAFGAGVNVCQGIAGCSMGSQDYFGDPVTTAGTHTIGAEDVPAPLSQVSNSGFEGGNCTSWTCYGGASAVTGNAYTGSYSVELPGGVSSGAEQVVTGLSPNTEYQLEGFAKSSVAGQCIYLGVKSFGGTETRTCLDSTSYTGGSVTFTTGASNTSADIYLWNPSTNSATGYGDDISLGVVPALHSYGALINTASSGCVDISGASKTAGTEADMWTCNGGANQEITRASNSELQVYPGSANTLCLAPSGGATSAGTAVVTASCTDAATQQWTVTNAGEITNVGSGLCLGPASVTNGAALQLQTCTDATSQRWNEQ
jgi:Ricin-type beta-trefoil lectin domain/Carbohydrate binding domain/Right handed beta helix region